MLFIFSTPRSGSNFFCERLCRSIGIEISQEYINDRYVLYNEYIKTDYTPTMRSYSEFILKKRPSLNNFYSCKILFSQLNMIKHWGDVPIIFQRPSIYLYRENALKQAVSLYFAFQQDIWTSNPVRPPRMADDDVPYDFKEILTLLHRIETHNANLNRLFAKENIPVIRVAYEEFLKDQDEVLTEVLAHIAPVLSGHAQPNASDDEAYFTEQRSTAKTKMYDRFLTELNVI